MLAGDMRWEEDTQHTGTGSAAGFAPHIVPFLRELMAQGWLTEDPIGHLAPKLRAFLDGTGSATWHLESMVERDGWLDVRVAWLRAGRARELRADVVALIGAFAEAQTFIASTGSGMAATFEVATGQPATSAFVPHGHLVRIVPVVQSGE